MKSIYKLIFFCCFLTSAKLVSQQTVMYTQYGFNKAGINPAAAGTEINQGLFYAFGVNRPWSGIDNSPKQNFINLSYTIRPPRSYRHWQNVGIYLETDRGGVIGNDNLYFNYTFHLLLRKTTLASFGVYAGARYFKRRLGGVVDQNDPAVINSSGSVYTFPDIIPGFRLSDKKYFLDIALKQITIYKLQDFKGRRLGGPSLLQPSIYFDYGRKIVLSDFLLMMPSIAVNAPLLGPPLIDYNVMFYYANTLGFGVGMRNISSASAVFQFRFFKKITVGFAYTYPVGNIRYAAKNSYELMIGVIPIGMNTKVVGKHSIAKCPVLNY